MITGCGERSTKHRHPPHERRAIHIIRRAAGITIRGPTSYPLQQSQSIGATFASSARISDAQAHQQSRLSRRTTRNAGSRLSAPIVCIA